MEEYLETIENTEHRTRLRQIFDWITENFPTLVFKTMWRQPTFLDHGIFIIGFSTAKGHLSVSPEQQGMKRFARDIEAAGYSQTDNLFRIRWNQPVDYELLRSIIDYNISDKQNCTKFWRS